MDTRKITPNPCFPFIVVLLRFNRKKQRPSRVWHGNNATLLQYWYIIDQNNDCPLKANIIFAFKGQSLFWSYINWPLQFACKLSLLKIGLDEIIELKNPLLVPKFRCHGSSNKRAVKKMR